MWEYDYEYEYDLFLRSWIPATVWKSHVDLTMRLSKIHGTGFTYTLYMC